jgi:hypothetical protein
MNIFRIPWIDFLMSFLGGIVGGARVNEGD